MTGEGGHLIAEKLEEGCAGSSFPVHVPLGGGHAGPQKICEPWLLASSWLKAVNDSLVDFVGVMGEGGKDQGSWMVEVHPVPGNQPLQHELGWPHEKEGRHAAETIANQFFILSRFHLQ